MHQEAKAEAEHKAKLEAKHDVKKLIVKEHKHRDGKVEEERLEQAKHSCRHGECGDYLCKCSKGRVGDCLKD